MKIFVGLGNPGVEYTDTRHNVGFMLADKLAEKLGVTSWREKFNALVAETFLDGEKIFIVKPLTYMNSSGEAVGPLMNFYKIGVEDLVLAHDDLSLPVGKIRLRPKGSGGGHHGVESVIQHLGNKENFSHIRVGISNPEKNMSVKTYVLGEFDNEEKEKISETIENLIPAVLCIFKEGINAAMNKFNPKRKKIE